MNEFLLEIGTEELPANFANEARIQIKEISEKWLNDNNITFSVLKSYSTPRRLTLVIHDILESQPDINKEVKGPAVSVSYDNEGKPTKALEGFCKSQNIDINTLEKRELKGNMFVYAIVKQTGKRTIELLPNLFTTILNSLSVTRGMRWGDNLTKFSRPIHWILALFNGKIVNFELDDIKSSNFTYGHRFLSNGKIEVNSVNDYFSKLQENKVILDNEIRKDLIKQQLEDVAKILDADVLIEESLLDEVNQLVEYPTAITGTFNNNYLEIPEVVNVTVMKAHQRYFPLFKDGNLLPDFITVSNMNLNPENIRRGNERVLKARLDDASFYYREDLKSSLESNKEELKRVTYFEEIGSIYDKTQRIQNIASQLSKKYFPEISENDVVKAASLSKSDLVTNMVKEFTELQGEIGYYYSIKENQNEEVSFAIREQYLPTGNNDNFPSRPLSQIINFSDKLDNLVSCFSLGKIPTGSKDPFSLRRQCLGIIKTCDKYKIPFDLDNALNIAFETLSNQKNIKTNKEDTINKIKEFFLQRLKNELLERGIRYDIVDSVLDSSNLYNDIYVIQEKSKALDTWVKGNVEETIMALARVIRISKEKIESDIHESLFEKEEEKNLYNSLLDINPELQKLSNENNYESYLNKLSELVKPINNFFDNVMVMVDNQDIKKNRLNLLYQIKILSDNIGNMDKIVLS
ncbi:MAG: glycine--tRNA ligase subunit beta [Candidatus Sericytochromatia bacterium]